MISFPAVLVAHALLLCVSLSAATVEGPTDILNVDMNVEDQGSRHLRNKFFRRRSNRGRARRSRGSRGSSSLLYRVEVTVSNPGPQDGTCQTPVWIGIHDGSFDIYNRNEPASPELERLAEDGNNMPLSDAFNKASGTVRDATVGCAAGILRPSNFRSGHSPINLTFLVMPPWSCRRTTPLLPTETLRLFPF